MISKNRSMNPTKYIAIGYCTIIMIGTLLLMLPISTRAREITPFVDAIFTATSATCVTGLIIYDTYSHWSMFGQLVLLCLIQIGGIGFMTVAISAVSLTKRKIGLKNRFTMAESVAAPYLGGIVRLSKFIVWGTGIIELIGTILLSFVFVPKLGFFKGIYFALFHAVSAFCNAGMDLMGYFGPMSSLMSVRENYLCISVIMVLIVIGGIGFFVWSDIGENKFNFKRYKLHTKIVLVTTIGLIVFGTGLFLLFEANNEAFAHYSKLEKFMMALFQSITPRTAGFNTVDLTTLTDSSILLTICLMLIGGSPGSTAGGMKTTTFLILMLTIISVLRQKKSVECFNRSIEDDILRQVCSVIMMYLFLMLFASMIIMAIDGIGIKVALFETASAVGTVGLSLGVTPTLSNISHIILALLMYFGRVGGISVLLALTNNIPAAYKLPHERVAVG